MARFEVGETRVLVSTTVRDLVAGSGFGFIGLLLAVPLLAIATVVWRFYRPAPEPIAPGRSVDGSETQHKAG
jgi:hypothetical protein